MEKKMTAYDSPIALGDLVRDQVSGFQGVVETLGFFMNGCLRVGVMATKV